MSAHSILMAFEAYTQLGPTKAAQVLDIAYATYAQYKNGLRPLPAWHLNQVVLLQMLPKRMVKAYIEGKLNG